MQEKDRFRGCLLGLAVGDAVGTTLEFQSRGSFAPIHDMVGGGPFNLKPGEWTDDTSMALCLAASLLHCGGFDPRDQINRYTNWWRHGYMSANGKCFDIGSTVVRALMSYESTNEPMSGPTGKHTAGNGSIMRLAPVAMFYRKDSEQVVEMSGESSRTTHGASECIEACRYFGLVLSRALNGANREVVLSDCSPEVVSGESIRAVAKGHYKSRPAAAIRGTGYVVESLEAALWSFHSTSSFEEAVLCAVNLGDDADTTGAVCGQLAGAYYGAKGIPARWLRRLVMADEIGEIANALYQAGSGTSYR